MGRKIVVCLDGTGNEIETHESNILRLYKCLSHSDEQLVYYHPGVGTLDTHPFSRMVLGKLHTFLGLIFGRGLEANVLRAFEFLCQNYREGDQLYFFGYSRGAYTARVLAGFINDFGLVAPHEFHLIRPVFKAWRRIHDGDPREAYAKLRMLEKAFHMSHPPIRFLGLWDTVSSLIRFRLGEGTILHFASHSSVNVNPSVRAVRHVLAIDERRRFFRHQFWKEGQEYHGTRFKSKAKPPKQDVKQVWFPGTHTDVAGSVAEPRAQLAKLTMVWMREQVDALGKDALVFRDEWYDRYVLGKEDRITRKMGLDISRPDACGPIHDQLWKGWFVLEALPRLRRRSRWPHLRGRGGYYLPLGQRRYIPADAEIDPSAYQRRDTCDLGYAPENLPPAAET